jgi:hypothetical protein
MTSALNRFCVDGRVSFQLGPDQMILLACLGMRTARPALLLWGADVSSVYLNKLNSRFSRDNSQTSLPCRSRLVADLTCLAKLPSSGFRDSEKGRRVPHGSVQNTTPPVWPI